METQFKTNGERFYPLKKLTTGIVLFASFFGIYNMLGGANGLDDFGNHLENVTFGFMQKSLAIIASDIAVIVLGIFMIYCAISGTYRICTCNIYNPVFEDKTPGGVAVKGSSSYPNINRVLNYRESKMSSLSSEKSAELYVGSSKIESLYTGYNAGPETQRTLSFIESKLSGMSSDRALNYLANKL